MNFIKYALLARLPWLNFLVAYLLITALRILPGFYRRAAQPVDLKSCLAIEAGPRGWDAIEFKELHLSAVEFFGPTAVSRVVVDKSNSYLTQIEAVLRDQNITHYLYDPRTAKQDYWGGLFESVQVAILLARFRVVPVIYLTDLSVRIWRCKSSAVSAVCGAVVTFMMPKRVQPIFPHRRLVGPSLMPLSAETLVRLQRLRKELEEAESIQSVVRFTGSLYEPRTTFLRDFKEALDDTGHQVEILGRELGSARVTDDEYWKRLSSAAIVITTSEQALQSGTDWIWIPHLVFRYLEVLASGSLLLASPVPGVARYFEPGKHFVAYTSIDEAIHKARYYLDHPGEAEKIRKEGHEMAAQLIRTHSFWIQIDTALGSDSLTS